MNPWGISVHYSTYPQDKEAESKPQRVTKKEQSDKEENEEVGRPRNWLFTSFENAIFSKILVFAF